MSVPQPPISLDNSCSVVYNNTLYSYSSQGFLSLRLDQGAKWEELDMGEKVTGAVCVGSTPNEPSEAGLYIVGGTTGSTDDYTGLQKFTYSTGNWTTITPSSPVTKDRQWHGATYIQADDVILVYAGSQNGVQGLSTQTFTIQASSPYQTLSFQSNVAPPAISPIVLSWSNADAAMMPGDGTNGEVYWFNPNAQWRASGASLSQPVQTSTGTESAVLITGDDGSKSFYVFNLAQSPNQVSLVVVQDASGTPVVNSAPVSARGLDERNVVGEKRDLTLDDWPAYNNTLAPTFTRQNFATAQDANGMIVFSGGNSDNPISVFNATQNSWINATELVGEKEQQVLAVSSTTTSQPTSTSASSTFASSATLTATSSATAVVVPPVSTANGSQDSGLSANAILGITLGIIAGILALLGLMLLLLRQHKRRQIHTEAGRARRASGAPSNEKDAVGFAKDTLPPSSPGHFRGHHHQMSTESTSSMAILMGQVGQGKGKNFSRDTTRSSTGIPKLQDHPALQAEDDKGVAFEPTIAEPRVRNREAGAQDGTRRSSGWNRYWSGGSALQILGFGNSKRDTMASVHSLRYSQAMDDNARFTQDSVTVPPLNFDGLPEMSRVNTGSPVVSSYPTKIPWQDGMSGTIERPISTATSGYSSGIPESVHDAWDPTEVDRPWGADRAPSSAYAPSATGVPPSPLGLSKQPQLAMASTSNDMSWLNIGDHTRV